MRLMHRAATDSVCSLPLVGEGWGRGGEGVGKGWGRGVVVVAGGGEFAFGCVTGNLHCRPTSSGISFTWEGNDEMDEVSVHPERIATGEGVWRLHRRGRYHRLPARLEAGSGSARQTATTGVPPQIGDYAVAAINRGHLQPERVWKMDSLLWKNRS
jgi:hypothetical protein